MIRVLHAARNWSLHVRLKVKRISVYLIVMTIFLMKKVFQLIRMNLKIQIKVKRVKKIKRLKRKRIKKEEIRQMKTLLKLKKKN